MAKPRIPNQKKQYRMLDRRLAAYMAAVRRIYTELSSEAAKIVTSSGYDGKKPFSWHDYPNTKARVRKLQERFVSQLSGLIMSGTSDEWKRSNLQQDLIVNRVLKAYHTSRDDGKNEKYYRNNEEALKAFHTRKEQGMNISNKLWDQSQAYREELQDVISVAIERGTDAVTLSKQISKYLRDFPSMQRDYKDKYGRASKAQNCEFRSIRLARSEINMAYRSAEQERWRQLDFVVGYEIKMSGAHPAHDVCDSLAGKYPKDFRWVGWHPNCMCYEIPILKTEDEFYGESKQVQPEIKGKVDSEKVESKLEGKSFMFETSEVFKYELHPEDREAVESFADRLGRFNPKGDVMSFSIDDVVQTQQYVGTKNVIQIAQSIEKDGLQDNPTGIKVGDKVFIVDGHNRIAAMRLGGSNTFDIRVVEVSEEEWKAAGGQVPAGGFESKQRIGSSSINEVHDVPQEFKDWCTENWQRIENSRHNDTLPYFLSDNRQYVQEQLTIERATEVRHAKRDEKSILQMFENRNIMRSSEKYDGYSYYQRYLDVVAQCRYYGIDYSEVEEYIRTDKVNLRKLNEILNRLDDRAYDAHNIRLSYMERWGKVLQELRSSGMYAFSMEDVQEVIMQFEATHPLAGSAIPVGSKAPKVATYREFANRIEREVKERRAELVQENQKKIENALAVERGKPMTHKEADTGRPNPNYDKTSYEWDHNCQCCVVTYEMRRRGYDVTAVARVADNEHQNSLAHNSGYAYLDALTGDKVEPHDVHFRASESTMDYAERLLADMSEVGRYEVSISWNDKEGHIFSFERKANGTILVYDPQNDRGDRSTVGDTKELRLLLEYIRECDRRFGLQVLRVDDKLINPLYISNFVKGV